jgi:signal recognition particle subunit SRP54
MGEGMDKLEEFRPEGLASRILGMGDVVGLVKDFEQVVDSEKAEIDAKRMLKGQFTMVDFMEQMQTLKKMGSLSDLMEKLPFFQDGIPEEVKNVDDGEITKMESIIQSMTKKERVDVSLFDKQPGRIDRVSKGCGRDKKEVVGLIDRFKQARDMMGALGKQAGLMSKIPGMKQLAMANKMKNAMGGGGFPGMPGMPGMEGISDDMLQAAGGGARKVKNADQKNKDKRKRKQAKKARKKGRKK